MGWYEAAMVVDALDEYDARHKASDKFRRNILGQDPFLSDTVIDFEWQDDKIVPVDSVGGEKVLNRYLNLNQRAFYASFSKLLDFLDDHSTGDLMNPMDLTHEAFVKLSREATLQTWATSRLIKPDGTPIMTEDQLGDVLSNKDSPWVCVCEIEV